MKFRLSTTIWASLVTATAILVGWRAGNLLLMPEALERENDLQDQVDRLARHREHLDETVWKEERRSHEYERTIVALWDELLLRRHAWSVLSALGVERLVLPTLDGKKDLGSGVFRLTSSGASGVLDAPRAAAVLASLEAQGYRLVQSEWHHERFEGNSKGAARSLVNVTLHVENTKTGRRIDVSGPLGIEWSARPDSLGFYRPVSVDATGVDVLVADRPAGFVPTFETTLEAINTPETYNDVLVWDLNDDGLPEIAYPRRNQLLWNRGEGSFDTAALCAEPPGEPVESIFLDLDGDGRVELLCVVPTGANMRAPSWEFVEYKFSADSQFHQSSRLAIDPLDLRSPDTLTPGDVDGDGDLDLWVTQYKQAYLGGQMPTPYYDANDGWPAYLLINEGDGQFRDETAKRGLGPLRNRRTYRSTFWDFDDDGDLDLVVVSDFSGVDMHRNNGMGVFSNVTSEALDERSIFGMSHLLDDFDGDGRIDVYVTGMASTTARRLEALGLGRQEFPGHQAMRPVMGYGNRLYLRSGAGQFAQPSFGVDVARAGWSWGCGSMDWNLDGYPEIYVANGNRSGDSVADYCTRFWCHDVYSASSVENSAMEALFRIDAVLVGREISWNGHEHNRFYLNREGRGFVNTAFLEGVAVEDDSRQVVATDFNADGRPDLLVGFSRRTPQKPDFVLRLYLNQHPAQGHWLGVRLVEASGHKLFGAVVTLDTPLGQRRKVYTAGDSFACQHPPVVLFGLGPISKVDCVSVRWSNGQVTTLQHPGLDNYVEVSGASPTVAGAAP